MPDTQDKKRSAREGAGANGKADDKSGKSDKSTKAAKNGKSDKDGGNGTKLSKADYLERLQPMQVELNNLARWLQHTRRRMLVIVEGRDTAGKGGVINAISETLNPRQCRTVALGKPSEREQGEWYFQRYMTHLPAAGELVLFDRSWYNRAGVEAVMGFCTPKQTDEFLHQAPILEKLLVEDGLLLFKYWLTVDQKRQEERFAERAQDPLKQWKLSPIDLEARQHYDDYGRARDRMLEHTHTKQAPWTLVDFNDQRRGRLTLIQHLLDHVPDKSVPEKALKFPPLKDGPKQERFDWKLKPIKSL